MKTRRAIKAKAKVIFIIISLHFFCNLYVIGERQLVRIVTSATNAGFARLARAAGYEPILHEPELTAIDVIEREAYRHQINPAIGRAVMKVESNKNPGAMSPKGALGLMQVMPFNAKRCRLDGPAQLVDPELNVMCGMQILAEEIRTHKHNLVHALQAYNGGPKCIGKCTESIDYSRKVLAELSKDIG